MLVGYAPSDLKSDVQKRADGNPYLQTLQVRRLDNGFRACRDLTETVVPDLLHDDEAGLGDLRSQECAELPVERGPKRLVVRKGEANPVNRGGWKQGRENVHAGKSEALQGARPELRKHVRVGAELVVRE